MISSFSTTPERIFLKYETLTTIIFLISQKKTSRLSVQRITKHSCACTKFAWAQSLMLGTLLHAYMHGLFEMKLGEQKVCWNLEKDLDQSVVQHSSLLRRAGAVKKLFDWSNWKCELVFFEMKLLWAKHFHCLLCSAQSYCWSRSWLPIVGFLFLKHTFPSWNKIWFKLSAEPPPGSEILS